MNNYRPSSELQRAAEEIERNRQRGLCFWWRWHQHKAARAEKQGNATIIKFPGRHGQITGARLPEPPEAA